jgi:hypothetical protein
LANVSLAVESMSCAGTSKICAGQQWVKPGHDEGAAGALHP